MMPIRQGFPSWSPCVVAGVLVLAGVLGWGGAGWGASTRAILTFCPAGDMQDCPTQTTPQSDTFTLSVASLSTLPDGALLTSHFDGAAQAFASYGTLGTLLTVALRDYRPGTYASFAATSAAVVQD